MVSVNYATFWMQQKNKEPGFSTEQYSKSKTQQLLGSVVELKKQFLGLNTKPWDLDISANNLAKQDIFLPNRQIGSQIFCQPCEESQRQECPLAAEMLNLKGPGQQVDVLQSPHGWMPPSTPQEFGVLHSFPISSPRLIRH